MTVYYNENDPFAAQWLRNLIHAKLIVPGDVDDRSIADIRLDELKGYSQCHFFAGIDGWSYALRLAGWPDDRPVWTGSCPCQPFSVAGKQGGFDDDRHLWPYWYRLIGKRRPPIVFGEQVAGAAAWLRLVRCSLEAVGYAVAAIPVEAASAGAYHKRDRFWFVADAEHERSSRSRRYAQFESAIVEPRNDSREEIMADAAREHEHRSRNVRPAGRDEYTDSHWIVGADRKARPVKPGVRLLAHGFPSRVGLLRGFGNAIDPRPATAFIQAYMDLNR